jgi:uncharacterized protein (TIGR02246 family)
MQAASTFDPSSQIRALTTLMHGYEAALNRADVDAVMALYAADAVFMAQHRQPTIGQAEIRAAYTAIFSQIHLHIAFEIDEIVVVTATLAYARTRSTGTTKILALDRSIAEANQELFILSRADELADWQIARYIFSTMQPPTLP